MRITKQSLLKLARETAQQRAYVTRSLMCVYLTGSLLESEPLLGGTTDIDLVFIHSGTPPASREVVRFTNEVSLDICHLNQEVFHQPRKLREDAWLGSFMCLDPICLHDVQHWFEYTQASVGAQFWQPEHVLQRAKSLADSARRLWMGLPAESGYTRRMLNYLKVLEQASNAIACLSGGPLTERRFLLNFPTRAEAIQHPGLAGGLVDLFTARLPDDQEWQALTHAWKEALTVTAKSYGCPPRLSPERLAYYTRAAASMQADHPAAAMWLILRTWTRALHLLPPDSTVRSAWLPFTDLFGLEEANLDHRHEELDAYLDAVEETLENWGKKNGIQQQN
jgi:hypothetical protein